MKIGVPKEIKTNENRVALVPAGAEALIAASHSVMMEKGAGEGSGFPDAAYTSVGARIGGDADTVWREADMKCRLDRLDDKPVHHLDRARNHPRSDNG